MSTIQTASQRASQRIRVLQVLGNAIVGGMETYVLRLIERLPSDQFGVTVLCPNESDLADQLRSLGADVFVTPMPENPPWASIQMVSSLIHAHAIDVLHAHLPNAHLLAGLSGKLAGKPVLSTIHGRQLTTLDLEIHRAASTHLSPVCQQTYFHALGLGVNPAQLHLIPNGVDVKVFRPPQAKPVSEHAPLIGFVGRLSPEKGPDVFLRVAMAVHQHAPQARFVLAGDGPMRQDLQKTIHRWGLDESIQIAGLVQDMTQMYAKLDVVVSTSRSEAMPLALMEAMACGVPVVATRVGGVPDLIQHGVTGCLAGDGDFEAISKHVIHLIDNPLECQAMGQRARDRVVAHFSLDQCIKATLQLLRHLAVRTGETRRVSAVVNGTRV